MRISTRLKIWVLCVLPVIVATGNCPGSGGCKVRQLGSPQHITWLLQCSDSNCQSAKFDSPPSTVCLVRSSNNDIPTVRIYLSSCVNFNGNSEGYFLQGASVVTSGAGLSSQNAYFNDISCGTICEAIEVVIYKSDGQALVAQNSQVTTSLTTSCDQGFYVYPNIIPYGACNDIGPTNSGPAGPQGPTIPPGVAGPRGPTSPPGAAGSSGSPGAAGPSGSPGAAGPSGSPGAVGPSGSTGSAGPSGSPGVAGSPGLPGTTGPSGPSGSTGAAGPPGAAGSPGSTGSTGSTGSAGSPRRRTPPKWQCPSQTRQRALLTVTNGVSTFAVGAPERLNGDGTYQLPIVGLKNGEVFYIQQYNSQAIGASRTVELVTVYTLQLARSRRYLVADVLNDTSLNYAGPNTTGLNLEDASEFPAGYAKTADYRFFVRYNVNASGLNATVFCPLFHRNHCILPAVSGYLRLTPLKRTDRSVEPTFVNPKDQELRDYILNTRPPNLAGPWHVALRVI